MINDFIDFVHELFPSISPYAKDKVKDALKQFSVSGKKMNCFMFKSFEDLCQGDIIETLPFTKYDEEGNTLIYKTKGILLSNSCDAENDSTVVFAPLIPISEISLDANKINNITKNLNFRLLYFPDPKLADFVVDLSLLNSYNKNLIVNSINNGKLNKVVSLSQFGYYLFLCKLTVHFLRPEDTGLQALRKTSGQ